MILTELLEGLQYELAVGDASQPVSDIVYDSRKAGENRVFVCLVGSVTDGHNYVRKAYDLGTRMFVCERAPEELKGYEDATVILVPDTRYALALISAKFFEYPARRIRLIGITGTKGKTSISFMLKAILECAGKKVGIIGSTGVFYGDTAFKLPNTTPESYELHKILYNMVESGMEYAILEATSQGFFMHRTAGIRFHAALFTNLSPDHISSIEHPSFEHYMNSKKKIFSQSEICFVNKDTDLFDEIVEGAACKVLTYGFQSDADYYAENVQCRIVSKKMAVDFICHAPGWTESVRVNIPGEFSASNALAAVCIADYFRIDKAYIAEGLYMAVTKGRMELVDVPAPYIVMIDFAHNALSVASLMETAKKYHPKRIICVFGLEGNRSVIRRYDSGEIIGREADLVILANASPRTEDPRNIINDIIVGLKKSNGNYVVIPDRREAIFYALDHAKEGDLVLLVGKGNVLYEEVNGRNIPFDERAVVREYFAAGSDETEQPADQSISV